MPIRAKQRIYRQRANGTRELAYAVGAVISDEDAVEMGLVEQPPEKPVSEKTEEKKPTGAKKPRATRDRRESKKGKP